MDTTEVYKLAKRWATAQEKADELRGQLEQAALEMRAEGASLATIGEAVRMSRPGVLKMLRRYEAAS
jgi:hypothetical protein